MATLQVRPLRFDEIQGGVGLLRIHGRCFFFGVLFWCGFLGFERGGGIGKRVDQKKGSGMVQVPVLVRMKRLPHVLHSQAASRAVGLALREEDDRTISSFGKLKIEMYVNLHISTKTESMVCGTGTHPGHVLLLNKCTRVLFYVIGAQRPHLKISGIDDGNNRVGTPPKNICNLFFFIVTGTLL